MKILPTINISKLNYWLLICIAKNFIWTTLKMIFSIFRFFCTLRFQIYKYCPNHTSMEILLFRCRAKNWLLWLVLCSRLTYLIVILLPYIAILNCVSLCFLCYLKEDIYRYDSQVNLTRQLKSCPTIPCKPHSCVSVLIWNLFLMDNIESWNMACHKRASGYMTLLIKSLHRVSHVPARLSTESETQIARLLCSERNPQRGSVMTGLRGLDEVRSPLVVCLPIPSGQKNTITHEAFSRCSSAAVSY